MPARSVWKPAGRGLQGGGPGGDFLRRRARGTRRVVPPRAGRTGRLGVTGRGRAARAGSRSIGFAALLHTYPHI